MTTTTTVQKIVQQSEEPVQRRINFARNIGGHLDSSQSIQRRSTPELIELD